VKVTVVGRGLAKHGMKEQRRSQGREGREGG